jgi:intracellular sulfur oxidation DsrE/DsrF family protein
MIDSNSKNTTHRRDFLGTIATGAAAMGLAALASPIGLAAETGHDFQKNAEDADAWFSKIKGKHRMVFDVTRPHEILPFAWPRVFLLTNQATGTPEKENNAVVIFRHDGIPFAFEDRVWAKYKFGEMFKVDDPDTKTASLRNPFWKPKAGEFKVPGLGPVDIGIDQLQDSGVMFCVCDVAMTVYSAAVGQGTNQDPAEIKKDWMAGLLPGIQVVPSGVWAVGRAQEHGCAYCFAG